MPNNYYRQTEVGDPSAIKQWSQLPTANNQQQFAQNAMLAKGLYGMLQPQPNFEPIKQQYIRDYRNNALPGILSDATNSGWGQQGSGFQKAVAGADTDLAYRLAALQQNFNQHQYDQNRDQSNQLLQQGLKPQFENMYAPVPYAAAEEHLKRQGIVNPSREQVDAALAKFQPPKPLGVSDVVGGAQGVARNARDIAGDLYGAGKNAYNTYKKNGLTAAGKEAATKTGGALNNAVFGESPMGGQTEDKGFKGGLSGPARGWLHTNPTEKENFDKSLKKQTPEQQEVSKRVMNDLVAMGAPILRDPNLGALDYQALGGLLESQNPKVQQLVRLVRTRAELKELSHYNEKDSTLNKLRLKFFLKKLINREKKNPMQSIFNRGK